jgi:hypothetical protein
VTQKHLLELVQANGGCGETTQDLVVYFCEITIANLQQRVLHQQDGNFKRTTGG